MQQHIDISTNNEMKYTITECNSGNMIAWINHFSLWIRRSFSLLFKKKTIFYYTVTYS